MSLFVSSRSFSVHILVAYAYFWLDSNSLLSSHLFTSSSCHILHVSLTHFLRHTQSLFYARSLSSSTYSLHSCTCFADSYHSLHSVFPALFILITTHSLLFPCLPSYCPLISYFISYLVHLGAPITQSPIFSHLIACRLSYLALFLGILFLSFSFFSLFSFATLLSYTSPPPFFSSLIVTISSLILSFTQLSTLFLTFLFSLIFLHPHFLSPSFYIFGATYV